MFGNIQINGYGYTGDGRRDPKVSRNCIRNSVLRPIAHLEAQNQSLLYATHQLTYKIGIVAPKAHQRGRVKSASNPKRVKTIQNIFFSMRAAVRFLPTF